MSDSNAGSRGPAGVVRAASEELIDRVQALADALRRAGSDAVGDLVPTAATDLLQSVRTVVEGLPAATAPIDLLTEEVKAKRAMVQAMQVQLASFDAQLEVLERALLPLYEWSRQWEAVQSRLTDPLARRKT